MAGTSHAPATIEQMPVTSQIHDNESVSSHAQRRARMDPTPSQMKTAATTV